MYINLLPLLMKVLPKRSKVDCRGRQPLLCQFEFGVHHDKFEPRYPGMCQSSALKENIHYSRLHGREALTTIIGDIIHEG